jgi:proteasome lid subunit RPN8/RPN11
VDTDKIIHISNAMEMKEHDPRIQLAPADQEQPHLGAMPLADTLRWNTEDDLAESAPLISVLVSQQAYLCACLHTGRNLSVEIGGALVGGWYKDPEKDRQFIIVENIMPARFTEQSNIHLTFTQDSLVEFHKVLDEHHQGKRIVGWYHSHPYMGIFLSQYDLWLHDNFFPLTWQVAIVIEPYSRAGGYFIRQEDGSLHPDLHYGFYEMNAVNRGSVVRWTNLYKMQTEAGG